MSPALVDRWGRDFSNLGAAQVRSQPLLHGARLGRVGDIALGIAGTVAIARNHLAMGNGGRGGHGEGQHKGGCFLGEMLHGNQRLRYQTNQNVKRW